MIHILDNWIGLHLVTFVLIAPYEYPHKRIYDDDDDDDFYYYY